MKGYIKDFRKELDSDIWMMPPLYHRTWQWLKYMANHEPNFIPMRDGSKLKIAKGQHLTSIRQIARGIGYYEKGIWKEPNPKTVKSIVDWLEKNNMIEVDNGNRKYTLISLLNWGLYQSKENESNSKRTSKGTQSKQQMETNKNDKNDKNDKKKDIYRQFKHLILTKKEFEKLISEEYTKEAIDDILDQIENYKKNKNYTSLYLTARNWLKKSKGKANTSERRHINATDWDKYEGDTTNEIPKDWN